MKKLILSALMLAVALAGAPAYAQGVAAEQNVSGDTSNAPPGASSLVVGGTITEISGSVVLLEEDPASDGGDKGYFTVTEATFISKPQGDVRVNATFEELAVGQRVEAAYAGEVMESYPSQGDAASIAILEEDVDCPFPGGCNGGEPPPEEMATLSFELAVEGEPPANAAFYGTVPVPGSFDSRVALADPDGDGLYTGSTTINRFGPGPRPIPPGTEPMSLRIQILQDAAVIKDFGLVKIDGDKTFEASVSFDGENPPPGEEVTVTGIVERLKAEPVVVDGVEICGVSTHAITDEATGRRYDLISEAVDLDAHVGKRVAATGTPLASPAIGGAGAERCPDLDVTSVEILDGATKPPPPPSSGGGSDDGGNGPGTGSGSDGGASGGGAVRGIKALPATGGALLVAALSGLALIAGGLVARRITR